MKNVVGVIHIVLLVSFFVKAQVVVGQKVLTEQVDMLRQYSGYWVSSVNSDTDSLATIPDIKMVNIPKMNNTALSVEVFQFMDEKYTPILTELIGHDLKSDTIVAMGQNSLGESFIGKGGFMNQKSWVMEDFDLLGKKTMTVDFDFKHQIDVLLKGRSPQNQVLWKTRYIKQNPQDKNIGVQLVSVKDEMEENPERTLKYLSR